MIRDIEYVKLKKQCFRSDFIQIEQKATKMAWKLKFAKSGATDFRDALKNSHLQNLRKHSIKSIFIIL